MIAEALIGGGVALAGYCVGAALNRPRQKAPYITETGAWAFPVDTLAQMLAIPEERRERFVAELPGTLRGIWGLQGKFPFVATGGAVWVDDGLGELRPSILNPIPNMDPEIERVRPLGDPA